MGKTQKKAAKGRLDKFYYMAKEHGYRSRAAFKLIQLNKKYDFLSSAKVCVDLCAAPGGWLQVAAKYMPQASIKIGVDLDPIKPIKGCVTFQEDITTLKCVNTIKKELKHFKCDIVMNDGAPNVGTDWNLDAYMQIELTLHAVKLASLVLRKGGTFVTKVFRSKDYNALMFVLNQLFTKVESTKPTASRSQSAEIFVVCQGYKAPDNIDPKLLDPKYALEQVDEEADTNEKITSLKKLITDKVNRSGYDREILYQEADLWDFLTSQDPHEYLANMNKFKIDNQSKELFKQIKPFSDIEIACADLKVCGRREFSDLLKYRHKYQKTLEQEKRQEATVQKQKLKQQKEEQEAQKDESDLEKEIDADLQATMDRLEKVKKRKAKKERELQAKRDLRMKMSVIGTNAIDQDQELQLSKRTKDLLKNVDIDELEEYLPTPQDSDENDEDFYHKKLVRKQIAEEEGSSDSDDELDRIDKMANEMEDAYEQQKEYQMQVDRKEAKRQVKKKQLIEQQRLRAADVSEEEDLDNKDLQETSKYLPKGKQITGKKPTEIQSGSESENDDDIKDEKESTDSEDEDLSMAEEGEQEDSEYGESELSENDEDLSAEESDASQKQKQSLFLNPLLANKQNDKKRNYEDNVSEGEWSDQDEQDDAKKKETSKKDEKLLKKRKKNMSMAQIVEEESKNVQSFFKSTPIDEVPMNDPGTLKDKNLEEQGYESLDSDEIAEVRALGKQMLRKKVRNEIIDGSYNRYSRHDNEDILPTWFLEDEAKHYVPNINLTKEQIAEEKETLKAYNARPSKKVAEAKARKKKRLAKAMSKIKTKAQVIANQDINEASKMKQIQKLYRKEKEKHKEEKTYVVNRAFNSTQAKKSGRNVKMVDSRMKKDMRAQKMRSKKSKKQGHAMPKQNRQMGKRRRY